MCRCKFHKPILSHDRNSARSRSNSRSRANYMYAAATFLLHAAAQAQASRTNDCSSSRHQRFFRTDSAFISRPYDAKTATRRSIQHGELESACGFGFPLYNTVMETEADTEVNSRLDEIKEQKILRLKSSIHYEAIAYSGTNSVSRSPRANVDPEKALAAMKRAKKIRNLNKSVDNDLDVKMKLTKAINNIWELNMENVKNGYKNGVKSNSRAQQKWPKKNGVAVSPAPAKKLTIRNLWKRRHARSIEEGIRREQVEIETSKKLSEILDETTKNKKKRRRRKKRFVSRTIAGLISALAEEATGLEVEVDSRNDTPLWGKQIDTVNINFSRLGVKALRMGGLNEVLMDVGEELSPHEKEAIADSLHDEATNPPSVITQNLNDTIPALKNSADEVFDRIDVDKSGALDEEELARALSMASGLPSSVNDEKSTSALSKLASRLVSLYDTNGDGVVDRDEYRRLVEDMTTVKDAQREKMKEREEKRQERLERKGGVHPLRWIKTVSHTLQKLTRKDNEAEHDSENETVIKSALDSDVTASKTKSDKKDVDFESAQDISDDPSVINTISRGEGSIVFTDLKLDLRRLLFGAVPVVKHITPGGPLILEPFKMTLKGSFTREDMLESALLDDGLRRLVARALRRRVRSFRDLLDGAVFYGRTWNMASKQAPVVEVPKIVNIEFDKKDRMIITGRAKIRAAPDQPFVDQSFKLRTKLGTRENGQYIRLENPELAIVLECPKAWERNIVSACKNFDLPIPERPDPLYQFIPLVSPIQKTEQDGFNLGEDNQIKSIYVKDDALRFEMSCVLRPGRFLGNHYLAFTVPIRTFIITMDRIREGIKTARQNKRELERAKKELDLSKKRQASDRYNRAVAQALSSSSNARSNGEDVDLTYKKELEEDLSFIDPYEETSSTADSEIVANRPGFFGRFLEGYLEAAREETERERNERLTTAISEFFSPDKITDASDSDRENEDDISL